MSHAQVEEISDSDPDEVFPADSSDAASDFIISPANIPSSTARASAPAPSVSSAIPARPAAAASAPPRREIPKHYQCLYPVYFDKSRSRAQGRKVSSELAVENPLAREIVDAVQQLGLAVGFEPEKLHPKDWANPGRVRVMVKNETGTLAQPDIKNSMCVPIAVRREEKSC